jgi:hypothetical protein
MGMRMECLTSASLKRRRVIELLSKYGIPPIRKASGISSRLLKSLRRIPKPLI